MTDNVTHRASLSTPSEWDVTKYSETPSRNGVAWSCTIRRNGTPVGHAIDDGHGGMTFIDFTDPSIEAAFFAEETARYGAQDYEPGGAFLNDLATLAQYARKRTIVFFTDDTDLKWGDRLTFRSGVTLAQAKAALTDPTNPHANKNPMVFDKTAKIFIAAADLDA